MKLLNFKINNSVHIGLLEGNTVIDLTQTSSNNMLDFPKDMETLIATFSTTKSTIEKCLALDTVKIDLDEIEFVEVLQNPEKIMCVGLNYSDHKNEVKDFAKEDKFPVIFCKNKNTLCAHNEQIPIPSNTHQLDYEVELVLVIGKEAKDIKIENAKDYIFGYTIGNDVSARDLQNKTSQWILGKNCDKFGPIGPYLVTKNELNSNNLDIKCFVNGELRQSSNTKNMIYSCEYLVSYLSKHMTLKPGDLIFTGTPSGVILGLPKEKQVWLKSGDKMTLVIDGLGTLENTLGTLQNRLGNVAN